MSDPSSDTEPDATDQDAASPAAAPTEGGSSRPTGVRENKLSRPSDFVARPGFRNPDNLRSKASRKKGRKKR
ncbi:MAG: hypothetical protein GXP62_04645 [Oligoflexia bacterium]|nr:hypothetical protein [Oligoflexia bacterium]